MLSIPRGYTIYQQMFAHHKPPTDFSNSLRDDIINSTATGTDGSTQSFNTQLPIHLANQVGDHSNPNWDPDLNPARRV